VERAEAIAATIYRRWHVGPYQWQVKHVRWYLKHGTDGFKPATRYRHWLTIRVLMIALSKEANWQRHLNGPWQRPTGIQGDLKAGRPAKRPT
jgi:hypothetical protein